MDAADRARTDELACRLLAARNDREWLAILQTSTPWFNDPGWADRMGHLIGDLLTGNQLVMKMLSKRKQKQIRAQWAAAADIRGRDAKRDTPRPEDLT